MFKEGLPCCAGKEKKCGVCRNGIDIALLIIRITLAVFFIKYGWMKLQNPEAFADKWLAAWPAPLFWAWLVALTEFFGGIAVLLGVFTRFFALGMATIALVAWGGFKGWLPIDMNTNAVDLLALGLALALVFAGPGKYSLIGMKHPAGCTCPICKGRKGGGGDVRDRCCAGAHGEAPHPTNGQTG